MKIECVTLHKVDSNVSAYRTKQVAVQWKPAHIRSNLSNSKGMKLTTELLAHNLKQRRNFKVRRQGDKLPHTVGYGHISILTWMDQETATSLHYYSLSMMGGLVMNREFYFALANSVCSGVTAFSLYTSLELFTFSVPNFHWWQIKVTVPPSGQTFNSLDFIVTTSLPTLKQVLYTPQEHYNHHLSVLASLY